MTKKTRSRNSCKERGNNRQNESHMDEISLRDEILKLKQEMVILKKTNEQYLVKLRKYEEDIKRKDKHLEQLMDPRKNSDITKVLSIKGAAILMNLRDENNSLIQIILKKESHIRRLLAQIKMSKLYASRRKNESYRAEIIRLKNLLIKLQETLKENVDGRQQTRSICVNGNSLSEFSSSSDQSSPRDLEELRLTILNLESHIKYSNDLLAEKNQKISLLTEEVNLLKKLFHSKKSKNKAFVSDFTETKNHKFSTSNFTSSWPDHIVSTKISSQNIFNVFEKNTNYESDNLPHSAPAAFAKWFSKVDSTPKYNCQVKMLEQKTKHATESKAKHAVNLNQENYKEVEKTVEKNTLLGKFFFHNSATQEIKKEEIIFSDPKKEVRTREKWKKALIKYREFKRLNPEIFEKFAEKDIPKNLSGEKAQELEKIRENYQILESKQMISEESSENPESLKLFFRGIDNRSRTSTSVLETTMNDDKECQNSENNSLFLFEDEKEAKKDEETQISSDSEKIFSEVFEKTKLSKAKSQEEICCQSPDSSSDSENTNSMKQMQVEVQINFVLPDNGNDHSEKSILEDSPILEDGKENGENDFSDDDDVIVCEK